MSSSEYLIIASLITIYNQLSRLFKDLFSFVAKNVSLKKPVWLICYKVEIFLQLFHEEFKKTGQESEFLYPQNCWYEDYPLYFRSFFFCTVGKMVIKGWQSGVEGLCGWERGEEIECLLWVGKWKREKDA